MTEIKMTLHMAPVAKGRPKFSVRGGFARAYTPAKTVRAENNILSQAIAHKPSQPFQNRVSMDLIFFMPIPKSMNKREMALAVSEDMIHTKKPDKDNLEKAVCDALNEVFWRDDSIIWKSTSEKRYSPNPRIEVSICRERYENVPSKQ